MQLRQYVVDAFTNKPFSGNPAAVCLLDGALDDATMQSIAKENGLSETAFLLGTPEGYGLRWFTPGGEIDLCGHATLGTAHVVLTELHPDWDQVAFRTMSGELKVVRREGTYLMDFPAYELAPVPVTDAMEEALGMRPTEAYMGRDLLCVLPSEKDVRDCMPSQDKLAELDGLLTHITARGDRYDCVSRSFAPKLSVAEDPVCGSGHCHIFPYWAGRLGKTDLLGYQASARGGEISGLVGGGTVILGGEAVTFNEGTIYL